MYHEYFLKQQLITLSELPLRPSLLNDYCREKPPSTFLQYWWEGPGKPLLPWVELLEALPPVQCLQFIYHDLDRLKTFFENHFTIVDAAGAIVYAPPQNYILFIFRRGVWDLPKGKLEEGEDPMECARREVEEETGVRVTGPGEPLLTTRHLFKQMGRWHIKRTRWFVFKVDEPQPTRPEEREGIEEARWLSLTEWSHRRRQSYLSVCKVLYTFEQEILRNG